MKRSAVVPFAAALCLLAVISGRAAFATAEPTLVGKDVPAFLLKDIDGGEIGTEQAKKMGNPIIVNFWGLRCGDCIAEIPYLNRIREKYGEKGLRIWGINVDGADADAIRAGIRNFPVVPAYPVVPDREFKMMDLFGVMAAPFTVVVSPAGKVVYSHEGFQEGDEKELEEHVQKVINR